VQQPYDLPADIAGVLAAGEDRRVVRDACAQRIEKRLRGGGRPHRRRLS